MIPSDHYQFPNAKLRAAALSDTLIEQPLVPPAKALDYKMGGAYSVLISHYKGDILVQGSAGFVPNALDNIQADVLFLGVGGVAGQTDPYQQAYWQHIVTATQPKQVFPIHFDSLTDALEEKPIMPNLLVSKVLKTEAAGGIQYARSRAEKHNIQFNLLPMWTNVVLFH
ncbi:hypothetical protein [Arenicella xantha]|uniref:Beta-lactamase family protein n=1 Tax=Arenicella xantha TaxID=644221 RepID=A0A395JKG2_9GAMM|nr:hypothetical protein [Arenicella xantha]RBP51273.1 hypothetical protein DFR28_102692 [Arenicella xantha]